MSDFKATHTHADGMKAQIATFRSDDGDEHQEYRYEDSPDFWFLLGQHDLGAFTPIPRQARRGVRRRRRG